MRINSAACTIRSMSMYEQAKHKHTQFRALLAYHAQTVRVFVDSRVRNVVLPIDWMERDCVPLDIGMDMVTPIRDLDVSDNGITATLSFNGRGYPCYIPWSAVWGMKGRVKGEFVWLTALEEGMDNGPEFEPGSMLRKHKLAPRPFEHKRTPADKAHTPEPLATKNMLAASRTFARGPRPRPTSSPRIRTAAERRAPHLRVIEGGNSNKGTTTPRGAA